MRIIAGKWRGRHIVAPPGKNTRPMLDRVKTVLFDMLGHRMGMPGRLPPLAVLDLFAGSGALGLEALSRGASFCAFVEQHHRTVAIIRRNLDSLEIVNQGMVIEADATVCGFPPPTERIGGPDRYELVLIDPPYRMLTGPRPDPGIRRLLQQFAYMPVISRSALIVVRHLRQVHEEPDLSPLIEVEHRDVGKMTLRFMKIRTVGNATAYEKSQ